jgi:undecaprenyl pyrophosphate phosphatase UppP
MKYNECLKHLLKDIFQTSGCLLIVAAILLGVNSIETINASLLWQIIIIALAYTLYKFAFANNLDLGKRDQLISFTICSILADIIVVLWLWLFTQPVPAVGNEQMIIYIIIIIVVKGAVYAMMYMDGKKQARQLNEKLNEYKNISRE